jgi:hypothetical protein
MLLGFCVLTFQDHNNYYRISTLQRQHSHNQERKAPAIKVPQMMRMGKKKRKKDRMTKKEMR